MYTSCDPFIRQFHAIKELFERFSDENDLFSRYDYSELFNDFSFLNQCTIFKCSTVDHIAIAFDKLVDLHLFSKFVQRVYLAKVSTPIFLFDVDNQNSKERKYMEILRLYSYSMVLVSAYDDNGIISLFLKSRQNLWAIHHIAMHVEDIYSTCSYLQNKDKLKIMSPIFFSEKLRIQQAFFTETGGNVILEIIHRENPDSHDEFDLSNIKNLSKSELLFLQ